MLKGFIAFLFLGSLAFAGGKHYNNSNDNQFWNDVWKNDSKCNHAIPNNQLQGLLGIKNWMEKNGKQHCANLIKKYAADNKITYCETKAIMECKHNKSHSSNKGSIMNQLKK